jgi:hypothetical protein
VGTGACSTRIPLLVVGTKSDLLNGARLDAAGIRSTADLRAFEERAPMLGVRDGVWHGMDGMHGIAHALCNALHSFRGSAARRACLNGKPDHVRVPCGLLRVNNVPQTCSCFESAFRSAERDGLRRAAARLRVALLLDRCPQSALTTAVALRACRSLQGKSRPHANVPRRLRVALLSEAAATSRRYCSRGA